METPPTETPRQETPSAEAPRSPWPAGLRAPEPVAVFATGGTIDKDYFDAKSAYEVGEPQVGVLFREAGVAFPFTVETLMRKDSLEMTDADRQLVAARVAGAPARCVVVTHGTDTMAETARTVADALAASPEAAGKTVVFVGSLAPARFKSSDAEFNVGFAAAAAQTLPPGAYVAMNGCVFSPYHVRKDRARNRFEAVPTADAAAGALEGATPEPGPRTGPLPSPPPSP